MANDAKPSPDPDRQSTLLQVVRYLLLAVFVAMLFLLGLSMVHHRFFQGERVHRNGSVGQ